MTNGQAVERQGSSPQAFRSRSIKFTPERLQQIKNLVERGKSRDEIADILDVTVGSLQVTCSKMGISLRRPKIDNGVGVLRKPTPLSENTSHHSSDHDGRVLLQATEEQSQGNSQSQPAEPAVLAKPKQESATTPDVCSASVAIRFEYGGMERTDELSLTPHAIRQLALEAALRGMRIGELIAEIITAMVNKGLFPLVLDHSDPATDRVAAEELN
jgi:hypothetical protein